ncbi:MAG: S1 family peptidase [Acidimicrobiia bacterium]
MASWNSRRVITTAIALTLALAGCGNDTSSGSAISTLPAPTTTARANTVSCDRATGLFAAASVVDPLDGWCGEWVDLARGRAIRGSTGSASLWTRRTEHGTALIVGAIHTLGQGWFGPENTAVEAQLVDPGAEMGVLRLFLSHPDGSGIDTLVSPWFRVFNVAIAAERNGNLMQDVLPREDFYVAATDSQKHDPTALPYPVPTPILSGDVPLYDPLSTTLSARTFAAAVPDTMVLLLGFPTESGELSAAVGRVLTDAEAEQKIMDLAALGDPEGGIAYEAGVEVIIEGAAAPGMSGGPVVDASGRLVAVMVRASDELDGFQYVRAVRMTHIASELNKAFDELTSAEQKAIRSYLES